MGYFLAEKPTPIFNTPDLKSLFGGAKNLPSLDAEHLLLELEMIALPSTVFGIVSSQEGTILEVKTKDYPSHSPLFIDHRFGVIIEDQPPPRVKKLPQVEVIVERICSCVGLPYIWGGNIQRGVPEMSAYYPPPSGRELSKREKGRWGFCGLDCSGLLYESTEGVSPRNTSDLLFFGRGVEIEGKQIDDIIGVLKPLDLLIYRGHLIIVLNQREVIESRYEFGGVRVSQAVDRLRDWMDVEGKLPTDDPWDAYRDQTCFLLRRFVS